MNNNIQKFTHPEFGEIRTLILDNEPWFIGNEIAILLGYSSPREELKKHVDKEDKNTVTIRDGNTRGNPNKIIINESGLYSLILSSKLPSAKKFKRWVTSEVLPAIRKHGAYLTPDKIEEVLLNPDTIIKIATELKEERKKNSELTATNKALVQEANTWDNNSIINALVRAYGSKCCCGNFIKAWNTFYKKLNYSLHINLRQRRVNSQNPNIKLIGLLTKDEMPSALKMAVAMCEDVNINAGSIINNTNLALVNNAGSW